MTSGSFSPTDRCRRSVADQAVHVHLFAAARAAAGAEQLDVAPGTLAAVIEQLVAASPALADVLPRCSFLLDSTAIKGSSGEIAQEIDVPAGSRLDVLPPFAGG